MPPKKTTATPMVQDSPEGSNTIPQPAGTVNTDTAPHAETTLPQDNAPPAAETAPPVPEPAPTPEAPSTSPLEADKKAIERDLRPAIRDGLKEGLRQMGRLPEYLVHEVEKLVEFIHAEVTKK